MKVLRVAAGLLSLVFFLLSPALAAEVTYSGIPGKWKRGTKGAKTKAAEADPKPKGNGTKKIIDNDRLKVTVGPKKG